MTKFAPLLLLLVPALTAQQFPAPPSASVCAGKRFCEDAASFAAIVRDFRTSQVDGGTRVVSATVRFLNKTNRPLTLGYLRDSPVAIDEQGNRYVLPGPAGVRGMGDASGREFDPKFTIAPGQTGDITLELVWRWNGRDIIGVRAWDLGLTVREAAEVSPRQYRFGRESALSFRGVPAANARNTPAPQPYPAGAVPLNTAALSNPGLSGPAMAGQAPPAAEPAGPPPPPAADACAGRERCYDAGPFVAEIVGATLAREGDFQDRVVRLNIQFRNKTNQPLILGYVGRTSVLTDNLGNRFDWAHTADQGVQGMGLVYGDKANPQFVLAPGQSRAATFTLVRPRPPRNSPDAPAYTYAVSIAQLAVLYNGQQIRTEREHAMTFADFGIRLPGAGVIPSAAPGSPNQLGDALRGILGKRKR